MINRIHPEELTSLAPPETQNYLKFLNFPPDATSCGTGCHPIGVCGEQSFKPAEFAKLSKLRELLGWVTEDRRHRAAMTIDVDESSLPRCDSVPFTRPRTSCRCPRCGSGPSRATRAEPTSRDYRITGLYDQLEIKINDPHRGARTEGSIAG
jgi:hypothetical protein